MTGPLLRIATFCYAFMSILAVCLFPSSAVASELVVSCTDREGNAVRLDRAELLVSGWGYAGSVPLKTDGPTVRMPLDKTAVRALLGDELAPVEELFLYMEGKGYAPVRSSAIRLGGVNGGLEIEGVAAFPGTGNSSAGHGDVIEAVVGLRRPVPRFLRLVDDDGRPVSGVEVTSYMYWSSSNHCARLSGVKPLGTYISRDDGTVAVPDGDMEYAFEIAPGDIGLVLKEPRLREYPERLVTNLYDETTVVRLHRRERVTLSMHVTRDGVPAPGETLYGCMADCPGGVCASCCGPLAVSGADGRVKLTGFVPEAYDRVYFQDSTGKVSYEAEPAKLASDVVVEVELGAGPMSIIPE